MKKESNNNLPRYSEWYLEKLAYSGAHTIYGEELPEHVEDRLKNEIEVIVKRELTDYFLIVQDLINTARKDFDAVIFPLRSNVSGNLVAYCLGISYLDPMKHDLYFESFVQYNTDSFPPICIVTDYNASMEIKREMKEKYGVEHIPGFNIEANDMMSKLFKVYGTIKTIHREKIDLRNIPLDDDYCFEVFKQGMTDYLGLFSAELRRQQLKLLRPTNLSDIACFHALYNHEVCKDIGLFIESRHHHVGPAYTIPFMRKYLCDTYGILIYQKQMMMLSRQIANFTREESYELLRRRSDELRIYFLERGKENGHDPQVLADIWAEWKKKAPYLISKSQAYEYAFMIYQIGYLKAHYPIEFQIEFPWNSEYRLRIF